MNVIVYDHIMHLTSDQIQLLQRLMVSSARKGNLANAGLVIDGNKTIASSESLVMTLHDATAHAEKLLVQHVCHLKKTNFTPGLIMVTVCEPCLMCISACAWAGYMKIIYIIPAKKYVEKIPWMTDNIMVNKEDLAKTFVHPLELVHAREYEDEFSLIFEKEMSALLK